MNYNIKQNKMGKYFLTVFLMLIVINISFISSLDSLGSFKRENCIELKQTCSSCTWVSLTVSDPDGIRMINDESMTDLGAGTWGRDFCNTTKLGRYDVTGDGDIDNADKTFAYYFEVTPTGFLDTLGFYIVMLAILVLVTVLGFWISEEWFVVMGGLGFMMLGVYSINYGIVGFRDTFMTWGIGLFEMGVGAILAIGAAWQKIDG